MDDWMVELRCGNSDGAWDLFIARYRRLIFSAIHHYTRDPDDTMDVFTRVCEALREDDLHRLRQYSDQPGHHARASTWLVTVVHHLTIDWFRHRNGRRRLSRVAEGLPPLRRRIFELLYLDRRPHVEGYEILRAGEAPDLAFAEFLTECRATHQTVMAGRHAEVLRAIGVQWPGDPPTQPRTGETAERRAVLDDAVHSLSTDERQVVDLYVMDGRPASAVATMLGLPNAKAVYNRVYRALTLLRERLESSGIRRGDL